MIRTIKLPNDIIALRVKRSDLSKLFEIEKDYLDFSEGGIRCRSNGKMYRRANALLYDHVCSDEEILVEVG